MMPCLNYNIAPSFDQSLETADDTGCSKQQSAITPGKLFIGGLHWQTTTERLQSYFGRFGNISECMIMRDSATKRSRGFGFVTFMNPNDAEKVLEVGVHQIDDKIIDPKMAFPRRMQTQQLVTRTKKLFVGGLSTTTTLDDVKSYFKQFGKIEDAMLMIDKVTQRHRGFAFVTFDNDEVVNKICEIHFHDINNKMVECKKAQPRELLISQKSPLRGCFLPGYQGSCNSNIPNFSLPNYYFAVMAPGGNLLSLVNNYSTFCNPGMSCKTQGIFPTTCNPNSVPIYGESTLEAFTMEANSPISNQPTDFKFNVSGDLLPAGFSNGFQL